MKRSIAIVLTIAIFTAVAVCFLRPAPPDFGYGDKVYTQQTVASDTIGDTDLVRIEECRWRPSYPALVARLRATDEARRFVLGNADATVEGRIEKLSNAGEWEYFSDITCEMLSIGLNPPPNQTVVDSAGTDWLIHFPITNPGHYRITCYFHEVDQNEEFSISFTADVPERSGHRHDVCGVWVASVPAKYSDKTVGYVVFALRSNDGSLPPYLDTESIAVTDSDIEPYIDHAPVYKQYYRRIVDSERFDTSNLADYFPIAIPGVVAGKEYRLSMTFAENPDGSGEQYTLTLRLRFGE